MDYRLDHRMLRKIIFSCNISPELEHVGTKCKQCVNKISSVTFRGHTCLHGLRTLFGGTGRMPSTVGHLADPPAPTLISISQSQRTKPACLPAVPDSFISVYRQADMLTMGSQ